MSTSQYCRAIGSVFINVTRQAERGGWIVIYCHPTTVVGFIPNIRFSHTRVLLKTQVKVVLRPIESGPLLFDVTRPHFRHRRKASLPSRRGKELLEDRSVGSGL